MAIKVTPGQQTEIETEYRSETQHRSDDSRHLQSPAGTVLLSMNQVSVQYDGTATPVLNAVSFTIRAGETVLLAGPSGCGKSTLALLCAGLIPDSVEALVEGQVEVHPSLAAPGGRAMVFQDPTTQFCMPKIADEIAFGLENQSVSPDEMPSQIAEAMQRTRFSIAPSREHHQLSGGQQQKLAIASALAVRPELLILDEPTSNLDPESTQLVFDEVAQLRAAGQTMLIVEHKFQPLLEVVDRVVLFGRDGRIYHEGPPHEVLRDAFAWMVEEGIISDDAAADLPAHSHPSANQHSTRWSPAIQIAGATVKRGDTVVWNQLDMAIPYGQLTAIVGPNGAGKSTLLQAMCGLHPLNSGEIELLGKPLPKWNKAQRMKTVSYCFQNPEFQFVYERVADEFANEVVSDPIPADLETQLANFGLRGTAQQSPFALSQGQKRRLSVAVMLHDEHEIYLLDEPTYGQDVKTQKAIMDMMVRLVQAGKTVVLTSHDMNLVRKYASNVVVIADGACLFSGTPRDLFARQDLLSRAHLKEIQTPLQAVPVPSHRSPASLEQSERELSRMQQRLIRHPTDRLNPAWLVVAMVVGGLLGTFAHNFTQAFVALAVSVVWVFVIARVRVTFALKWYAWFAMIYAFYIWSFAAYAAVPPGYAHFRVGWINFSWFGMHEGLLMAVKMFSSVGYLVVMTGSLDLTNLIVALSKNMRVPPKFAFGILAGLRLAPLLRAEWGQLKLARQLRGKDSRFAMTRPVRYAIPLLSQGVRMSERVAVAMEARGLIGEAARSSTARTYFREMNVQVYDIMVTCVAILIPAAILIFVR